MNDALTDYETACGASYVPEIMKQHIAEAAPVFVAAIEKQLKAPTVTREREDGDVEYWRKKAGEAEAKLEEAELKLVAVDDLPCLDCDKLTDELHSASQEIKDLNGLIVTIRNQPCQKAFEELREAQALNDGIRRRIEACGRNHVQTAFSGCFCCDDLKKALDLSPASALASHDAEVRREAFEEAAKMAHDNLPTSGWTRDIVERFEAKAKEESNGK